jgi:hypothetical protein
MNTLTARRYVLGTIGVLSVVAGVVLVAVRVVLWLRSGEWFDAPLGGLLMLQWPSLELAWPYEAHTWLGLAKIVRWLLNLDILVWLLAIVPWSLFLYE